MSDAADWLSRTHVCRDAHGADTSCCAYRPDKCLDELVLDPPVRPPSKPMGSVRLVQRKGPPSAAALATVAPAVEAKTGGTAQDDPEQAYHAARAAIFDGEHRPMAGRPELQAGEPMILAGLDGPYTHYTPPVPYTLTPQEQAALDERVARALHKRAPHG